MGQSLKVMNNEDKLKNYRKRKLIKYLMIISYLATITLEAFSLFHSISFLWGLIPFIISYYLKAKYEGIEIKDLFKRKK